MYNKKGNPITSSKVNFKKDYDKLNEEEYVKLKLDYERSKKELEDINVKSFIKDLNSIHSKETLSEDDYNKIFRLKRRIARTETFAEQYYDWFKKNLGISIGIYEASRNKGEYYYAMVTYGEGLAKGMYLDFKNTFLRVLKKSDFYNDYGYTVTDKKSNKAIEMKFKELIEAINKFIEDSNGELNFVFKYNDQEIVYPIFEKVDYLEYKGDIYNCRLVLNEDIAEYLQNIIDSRADVESNIEYITTSNIEYITTSNIEYINVSDIEKYEVYDNVINFNAKR